SPAPSPRGQGDSGPRGADGSGGIEGLSQVHRGSPRPGLKGEGGRHVQGGVPEKSGPPGLQGLQRVQGSLPGQLRRRLRRGGPGRRPALKPIEEESLAFSFRAERGPSPPGGGPAPLVLSSLEPSPRLGADPPDHAPPAPAPPGAVAPRDLARFLP